MLGEGQRPDLDGNIAAGNVCGELPRQQVGVGAGEVQVGPAFRDQRVDQFLPVIDLLDLVEQDVDATFLGEHLVKVRFECYRGRQREELQ